MGHHPTISSIHPTRHGDFHYDVVIRHRSGREHVRRYVSSEPLEIGDVVRVESRYWLVESIEPDGGEVSGRVTAKPARYRLTLRHPDGRDEAGAFRRYRPDAPKLGHAMSTLEDGRPVSWEVVDKRPAYDQQGEIYLELIAERDFAEAEELPDHELEHALARRAQEEVPEGVAQTLERAEEMGLSLELVGLEPGDEPDWEGAERYIEALILEEIGDDLIELSGIDPARDQRETWLGQVKARLRSDLANLRADVEGDQDEIEQRSYRGGWILTSVGREEDEADPDKGHGWMTRLVDGGVLTAASFQRVRKPDLM
jgi:hypothetical protein